jgi:hypothetical protein
MHTCIIYIIRNSVNNSFYIGSSKYELTRVIKNIVSVYNCYKNMKKANKLKVFELFDSVGLENCYIFELEKFRTNNDISCRKLYLTNVFNNGLDTVN